MVINIVIAVCDGVVCNGVVSSGNHRSVIALEIYDLVVVVDKLVLTTTTKTIAMEVAMLRTKMMLACNSTNHQQSNIGDCW